ncbi:hypothetical protein GYA37_01045 [candidate division WWE3 bacterium]|uniref:Uncharacterized protein n=1 Tax=candidate division WWE3 bacterium TaxID=2053526 RepID=A0A7X9HSP2_UNCKA|nr:hypothetical protein [candidate division WWE3 bacterium]
MNKQLQIDTVVSSLSTWSSPACNLLKEIVKHMKVNTKEVWFHQRDVLSLLKEYERTLVQEINPITVIFPDEVSPEFSTLVSYPRVYGQSFGIRSKNYANQEDISIDLFMGINGPIFVLKDESRIVQQDVLYEVIKEEDISTEILKWLSRYVEANPDIFV